MSDHVTHKIRTKIIGDVITSDLDNRELIFGNSQSAMFMRTPNDDLLTFPSISSNTNTTTTWSSSKINTEIQQSKSNISIKINQTSHGFNVGNVIYFDKHMLQYQLASMYSTETVNVIGIVSRIINDDIFEFVMSGYIDTLSNLIIGEWYYLGTNSGVYTTDSMSGSVQNKYLFQAISYTEAIIYTGVTSNGSTSGSTAISSTSNMTCSSVSIPINAISIQIMFDQSRQSINYAIMCSLIAKPSNDDPAIYNYIITEKTTFGFTLFFSHKIEEEYFLDWAVVDYTE